MKSIAIRIPIIVVIALLGGCKEKSTAQPIPPSIVLVTLDTLRSDHLGTLGYFRDTSPNIDAFAKQSVLFENTYTTMATTLPAHLSLLTSTYTTTHGIKGNIAALNNPFCGDNNILTLTQMLKKKGYETAAFVSAVPVKKDTGISVGFNTFDEPQERSRIAEETNKKVLTWLESNKKQPFFLWVHYFDPHTPFDAPLKYQQLFSNDPKLEIHLKKLPISAIKYNRAIKMHNGYDAEIRYLDHELENLFNALKTHNSWKNTAVVLASDHGEGLGQHDWDDHGRIYNEQLRVLLAFKFPDTLKILPKRSQRLASLVDVVPTLIETLKLPLATKNVQTFEGVNLMNDKVDRKYVFAERTHRRRRWKPGLRYALISADWKFMHEPLNVDFFYDLKNDPGETQNVIKEHSKLANQFLNEIKKKLTGEKRVKKNKSRKLGKTSPANTTVDSVLLEQLNQLGYVEER